MPEEASPEEARVWCDLCREAGERYAYCLCPTRLWYPLAWVNTSLPSPVTVSAGGQ